MFTLMRRVALAWALLFTVGVVLAAPVTNVAEAKRKRKKKKKRGGDGGSKRTIDKAGDLAPKQDFNLDEALNGADIDMLMNEVAAGTNDAAFDLSGDGLVNDTDRDDWLALAGPQNGFAGGFLVGDSNLDGIVDAEDLNALGVSWQSANNNWSNGNFTGGGIDAADLNALALNWRESVPLAAANSAVPEPATITLALLSMALFARFRVAARR